MSPSEDRDRAMQQDYLKWVREEAKKINSDGCSGVPDFHKDCCLEHDLAYFWGRDPIEAYKLSSGPHEDGVLWSLAGKITRSEADARFRKCQGDLMGFWRWLGVRIGGRFAWNNHRKVRS